MLLPRRLYWGLTMFPAATADWVVLPLPVIGLNAPPKIPALVVDVGLRLPLTADTFVTAVFWLRFEPNRLNCGLKMLLDNNESCVVFPAPRAGPKSPPRPPASALVVVTPLPFAAETLLMVVFALELLPKMLVCGLMMLYDAILICVTLPLPLAPPSAITWDSPVGSCPPKMMPPMVRLLLVLLPFPPRPNCGRKMLPSKMLI